MSRNSKRLLMSFLLSLSCVAGTQIWYKSQSSLVDDNGDREPMASLTDLVNEVQRKPMKRLIWQNLVQSESLFSGELIRTNESSEATIEILKTGTILQLEPESLVSLDERDGKIELEFLRGHLYVIGGTGDVNLKTGTSRIKLAGAELALGRGAGDGVDMQVFKGNVEVEGTGIKKVKDDFVIISPQPQSEVHILPDGKERVKFEWKTLPKPYNVIVEVGKTRSDLKASTDQKLDGNKILAQLAPGDYYFRLIGSSKDPKEEPVVSSVFKFKVLPKRAPVPLSPEKDVAVNVEQATSKVVFKWANPGKLGDLVVEVAESADLKTNPQIKKVGDLELLEMTLPKNGTYYWRITGYIGQTHDPVSSTIQKFSYVVGANLNPPILELPNKGEKVSFQTLKEKGIFLQWKPMPGAQSYRMILKDRKAENQPREEVVPVQQVRFNDLKPGVYDWQVVAIGANKKESKPSETWSFSVEEMPILQWKDGKDQGMHQYWSEKPEFFADWNLGPKGTESYRVRLRPEGQEAEKSKVAAVKTAEFKATTEKDGRYIASVEALNKDGAVVAKSNERIVEIKPMPILEAPKFEESVPNPLKSTRNGNAEVSWKTVQGATSYVVVLKNNSGKIVKEEKLVGTHMGLSKLLPGEYALQVRAIDQGGRKGQESEARPLLVPDMSDVRAPKVKTIKVE